MITFMRSLSELMAITESRDKKKDFTQNHDSHDSRMNSGQRKNYIETIDKKEVGLPNLPKRIRRKWIQNKKSILRFIDDLDYNNQIQSSYDLTLIQRQNKRNQQDAA